VASISKADAPRDGHRVRVYLPFGRQWFPYFMRRLGERPANLMFVIRSLLREDHRQLLVRQHVWS
jgi:proline dehydrogenase